MQSKISELLQKGNSFFDERHYSDAIACYDEVLENDQENQSALLNKGASLSHLGRLEEALVCYDKVLEIDPKEINALFSKGNTLLDLARLDEAIVCYDKALKIDPHNVLVLEGKIEVLLKLGKVEEAGLVQYKIQQSKEILSKALWTEGLEQFSSENFCDSIDCFLDASEISTENAIEMLGQWFEEKKPSLIINQCNPTVKEPITTILHLANGLKNYPKTSLNIIKMATLFSSKEKVRIDDFEDSDPLIEIFKSEFVRKGEEHEFSEKTNEFSKTTFDEISNIMIKALKTDPEKYVQLSGELQSFWLRLREIDDSLKPITALASAKLLDENKSNDDSFVMFHLYCYTYLLTFETLLTDVLKKELAFLAISLGKMDPVKPVMESECATKSEELRLIKQSFKQLLDFEPVFLEDLNKQEKIDIRNAIAHGLAFFDPDQQIATFKCQYFDERNFIMVTYKTISKPLLWFVDKLMDIIYVIDSFRYVSMLIDVQMLLAIAISKQF